MKSQQDWKSMETLKHCGGSSVKTWILLWIKFFLVSYYYSCPLLSHSPQLLNSTSAIKLFFSVFPLTAELLQRLLRVRFPIAALPNVTGLQLYRGLHARQGPSASFQVHLGKQLPASSSWLIVHSLVPTLKSTECVLHGKTAQRINVIRGLCND